MLSRSLHLQVRVWLEIQSQLAACFIFFCCFLAATVVLQVKFKQSTEPLENNYDVALIIGIENSNKWW